VDNANLSFKAGFADLAIEGWNFGHATSWHSDQWQTVIERYLDEMFRVLKPNGLAILLETMGTGATEPTPPNQALGLLYQYLETQGFTYQWFRTDYQFPSVKDAIQHTQFFFGDEMAKLVEKNNSAIVPECTGMWYRKK